MVYHQTAVENSVPTIYKFEIEIDRSNQIVGPQIVTLICQSLKAGAKVRANFQKAL